jgi:hypothetical protein
MVMPYYEGPTLKAALAELGRAPSEAELRAWLKPLLDALAVMHAAQCYHRDIAPDNILLTPRGPLLLDFGAARRVIGDMTHAITVVLKPGYAPIEQYGDVATMAQGAWTDLYALACVVYYAIAGKTPTSSVERLMDDRVEPLASFAAGRYSDAFLRAIDAALAVRPTDRPQTVRQFRTLLDAGLPPQPADDERDTGAVPYATVPGTLTPPSAPPPTSRRDPAIPAFEPTAARTVVATAPDTVSTPSDELPSSWREPATSIELRPTSEPPDESLANTWTVASAPAPPPLAPRGTTRNPAATLLVGAAIVAVIATVAVFVWVQQRSAAPPSATFAAPSLPTPAAGVTAGESPPAIATPAARPSLAETPIEVSPGASAAAPIVVERAPNEAPPPVAATIEGAPETAPAIALPDARSSTDADAASGVAAAATRAPRPRREAPAPARTDNATAAKPAPPHAPVVSSRCSDILQKASLEPLTASEAAYLKKECR